MGRALQGLNIGVNFSGGYFIYVTPFAVTSGETPENTGDDKKIIIPTEEKVDNPKLQINKVVCAPISGGLGWAGLEGTALP